MILVLVPFWTSILVRVAAWIVLLQREGLVNKALLGGAVDQMLSYYIAQYINFYVNWGLACALGAWLLATKNSFIVAPTAAFIATVLGTLAAVGHARVQFFGKGLLISVLILPMVVPVVVVAVATYLLFARIGLSDSYDFDWWVPPWSRCHRPAK